MNRSLFGLLASAAVRFKDRPMLLGRGGASYAEMHASALRLANALRSAGIGRGDRALIVSENRAEVVTTIFALNALGATSSLLHHSSKPRSVQQVCENLAPNVVFLEPGTMHLRAALPPCKVVVYDAEGDEGFAAVLASGSTAELPVAGIDLDPACIIYTSGSTGVPRGVVLSNDNMLFATEAIQARLDYQPSDRIGVFLPLSFDYGQYQLYLAALSGAAVVLPQGELAGPALLNTLREQEISVLPAVPQLAATVLALLERRPEPLTTLRKLTNTGAHLPQEHVKRLKALLPHLQIYPMYGLTECKRVAILLPEEADAHPGSVGRAIPGTETFIVDDEGKRVPPLQVGELVVRGRHVALGYYRAPEETAKRYRPNPAGLGGALFTGDNCYQDADGFLYFVGRRDEQIKRMGYRLHPLEIEEAACAIPGVQQACVVYGADRLTLFAVTDGADGKHLRDALREVLEPHKVPDAVEVVAAIPKTANGKYDRKLLLRRLAGEES